MDDYLSRPVEGLGDRTERDLAEYTSEVLGAIDAYVRQAARRRRRFQSVLGGI